MAKKIDRNRENYKKGDLIMGIINIKRLTEQVKRRKTMIILDIIGLLLLFATPAFIIAVTDKFKLFFAGVPFSGFVFIVIVSCPIGFLFAKVVNATHLQEEFMKQRPFSAIMNYFRKGKYSRKSHET